MNIDSLVFWKTVGDIVMKFPGTEASTSYGTPTFKVNKKLFVGLKEDGQTIVVYTNERGKWMTQKPKTFFINDDYNNYWLMLIDLLTVSNKDLKTLLHAALEKRAPDRLKKEMKK